MKKLYLFTLVGLTLASCVNVEEPQAINEATQKVTTRSTLEKDPYKLSLIQEVLDQHSARTRSERIVLEPTHLYVRFLPQDSLQVAAIDALGINTFYIPIGEQDVETDEPEVGDDDEPVFCWTYAVVPANFVFPEGITHEIIYESFIQGMDNASASSGEQLPTDLYRSILNETLAMTGKSPSASSGTSQVWNPSAKFRLAVNTEKTDNSNPLDTISLPMLNVYIFQGSRIEVLRTNSEGETGKYSKFIGAVDFKANWDSDDFVIWEGNNWVRRDSWFRNNTAPLDIVINEGFDAVCAALYRAMHAYCYENYTSLNGLVKERRFFQVGLLHQDAGSGWRGRYIWGLRRPLAMYAKASGQYRTSGKIMATAFHELGHASHNYKNNTDYVWAYAWHRKKMESWAEGISYAFMNALFPKYKAITKYDGDYTRLMECLLVNGFTVDQLQFDFYGSISWYEWRDRLMSRSDKPISAELISHIFEYPDTYAYDFRDVINVSRSTALKYQPVTFTLKSEMPKLSKVKWEIVSGTGGQILLSNNSRFRVCFKTGGMKTIRTTITLQDGFQMTYEKEIYVSEMSIIEVPSSVIENYEFTVKLRPDDDFPIAKVGKWESKDPYVTISNIKPTSASFKFTQPGANRKIQAKVLINTITDTITCEAEVDVMAQGRADKFAVVNPPEIYFNDITYKANFMNNANINIEYIDLKHNLNLPELEFTNQMWSYSNKILTFKIPLSSNSLSFDYTLVIHYTIEGLPDEQLAYLLVSNFRDDLGGI